MSEPPMSEPLELPPNSLEHLLQFLLQHEFTPEISGLRMRASPPKGETIPPKTLYWHAKLHCGDGPTFRFETAYSTESPLAAMQEAYRRIQLPPRPRTFASMPLPQSPKGGTTLEDLGL